METQIEGQEVTKVEGNRCKKGMKHAEQELFFPGRVLTTTMNTDITEFPLLPVRSSEEIPKDQLMPCMGEILKHHVTGPAKIGQPIIKDILGMGVDIIACRTIPLSS